MFRMISVLAVLLLANCANQRAAVRSAAVPALACNEPEVERINEPFARAVGCGKAATFEHLASGWTLESLYPARADGQSYVPSCSAPERLHFQAMPAGTDLLNIEGSSGVVEPKVLFEGKMSMARDRKKTALEGSARFACELSAVGLLECCDPLPGTDARLVDTSRENLSWLRFDPARKDSKPVPVRFVYALTYLLE